LRTPFTLLLYGLRAALPSLLLSISDFSCFFLFRFPFFFLIIFLVPGDRPTVCVKIASRIVSYRKHFSTFFFNFVLQRFYSAPNRRARSIAMSVSVCLCVFVCPRSHLRNYTSDLHQVFLRTLPLAVARFSSGGVVIRYLFPVLCTTSYLHMS